MLDGGVSGSLLDKGLLNGLLFDEGLGGSLLGESQSGLLRPRVLVYNREGSIVELASALIFVPVELIIVVSLYLFVPSMVILLQSALAESRFFISSRFMYISVVVVRVSCDGPVISYPLRRSCCRFECRSSTLLRWITVVFTTRLASCS